MKILIPFCFGNPNFENENLEIAQRRAKRDWLPTLRRSRRQLLERIRHRQRIR
jgi:hypothetical protein